jgi:hypothetical protein
MRSLCLAALTALLALPAFAAPLKVELVEVRKIWDAGGHNAFTDLIRFRDRWWCCFREADGHIRGDGKLRVITSTDGEKWESAALIEEKDIDLRDPKLSITPDNRLMMTAGGSVYLGTSELKGRQPRVLFSSDGRTWTAPQRVMSEGDWLWRVTWHDGIAYGTSYRSDPKQMDWSLSLYRSTDGLKWELVGPMEVSGRPNETTLRFIGDEMVALVRREAGSAVGWIGTSKPPYKRWTWRETDHRLGGPNFIQVPDGSLWAGSRAYGGKATMVVASMTADRYEPVLTLPSGGDNSYPGLVWHEGQLWVSYYSSHEGKTNVYLAKVKLPIR